MLEAKDCVLLLIDVQERLTSNIKDERGLLNGIEKLVLAMHLLQVPIVWTEQYPQGLGPTHAVIQEALGAISCYEKKAFGVLGDPDIRDAFIKSGPKTVFVAGVETHICVLQSVLQLLEAGHDCRVVVDACSAQKKLDHEMALMRMQAEGGRMTTIASLLFELLGSSDKQVFKEVSALVKELR